MAADFSVKSVDAILYMDSGLFILKSYAGFEVFSFCFSPGVKFNIFAFYGLLVYGDVWNSIGWSLWRPPCIQSTHVALG